MRGPVPFLGLKKNVGEGAFAVIALATAPVLYAECWGLAKENSEPESF